MALENVNIEQIVTSVVEKIMKNNVVSSEDNYGKFNSVSEAVEVAWIAQKKLVSFTLEKRGEFITAMREAILANAEILAEMAVQETKMGRVADKVIKHRLVAEKAPGIEDLKTEAITGDHGLTLIEMAPYGVICAITPSTNPVATIMNNAINMVAAGNSVVFCPHPSARETSLITVEILNKAIISSGGPDNLLCTITEPSIKAVEELMAHPKINLVTATGGPGVVKAALSSGKKAIGAGAGNPPVIVDETADIEKATKDIVDGATFDNNLPCIAEKAIIAIGSIADRLISNILKYRTIQVQGEKLAALEKLVLIEKKDDTGRRSFSPNKQFIGKDAKYILEKIGIDVDDYIRGILVEVDANHPFLLEELMMPILPLVQVKNVDEAITLAVKVEHGNRHTALIHSKNVDNMTRFAKAIKTTVFVKNAPCYAGIGFNAEGFPTFTIAGPTGEGITSTRSFTRQRRCVLVDGFSIV